MVLDTSQQLVDQWVATWLHIRGIGASTTDGWPLVHVGSTTRETELVCLDPGLEAWARLLRRVAGDPRAMLTVAAEDVGPYLTAARPDGTRIDRDDESLMSAALVEPAIPGLPVDLTSRWDVAEHRATYTLESGDSVAAVGTVGVLDGIATFDGVETMPAFQRQGLGRHVMATLTAQAVGRGATHGVLAASAQGRQLYSSLGWDVRLEMLSVMGT
jgi:GNAT superfamily N-acetyltransferase